MSEPLMIVVQARMGGSRFPGKVLAPLLGQPMLLWELDRLSRVQTAHHLVVAVAQGEENHAIMDLCAKHGYDAVMPDVPENDVLARYQEIAESYDAAQVVRVTGDCPLVSPDVVDALVTKARESSWYDHLGIAAEWPDGTDAEWMTRRALDIADYEAKAASDREHCTPYLWRNPQRFRCARLSCPFDLSWQKYSVDTEQDLGLVSHILERCLNWYGSTFGWREIAHVIQTNDYINELHQGRPPRNHRYVEQVAQERGGPVESWEQIRYSGGTMSKSSP